MKPFAIKINSEQEYKKVKKYAEKWGYGLRRNFQYYKGHEYVWFENHLFNPCHSVGDFKCRAFDFTSNWHKHIRKKSPYKNMGTNSPSPIDGRYNPINLDLRDINELGESISVASLHEKLSGVEKRIDTLAKNYNIPETFATKKDVDALDHKIRLRLHKMEEMMQDDEADGMYPPLIPKIAIRVENKQECKQLMKIYSAIGWRSIGNKQPDNAMINWDYPCLIGFNNNFGMLFGNHTDRFIIPFSTIKGLKWPHFHFRHLAV